MGPHLKCLCQSSAQSRNSKEETMWAVSQHGSGGLGSYFNYLSSQENVIRTQGSLLQTSATSKCHQHACHRQNVPASICSRLFPLSTVTNGRGSSCVEGILLLRRSSPRRVSGPPSYPRETPQAAGDQMLRVVPCTVVPLDQRQSPHGAGSKPILPGFGFQGIGFQKHEQKGWEHPRLASNKPTSQAFVSLGCAKQGS